MTFPWERHGCQSPRLKPCRTISDKVRIALSSSLLENFWELVKQGVDINFRDRQHKTPLHLVIEWKKDLEIVKAVLSAGADTNAIDSQGRTPLHAAIRCYSSLPIIKAILDAGADINIPDSLGRSPLMATIHHKSQNSIIKALIIAGADVNAEDLMVEAVKCNADPEVIRYLIMVGVSVNRSSTETPPLSFAIVNDDLKVVKLLLAAGAEIQSSSLHLVKGVEVAEELIKHGLDVNSFNSKGRTALQTAVSSDFLDVATTLIRAGADVHRLALNSGDSCFHFVRSRPMVKMLVSHGANVNARNEEGSTPLHRLVRANYLLTYCNLNDEPFSLSERKRISGIKELINCGADIYAINNNGKSVLEFAANHYSSKIAVYLIKLGVEVPWRKLYTFGARNGPTIYHMIREWSLLHPSDERLFNYPMGPLPEPMISWAMYALHCSIETDCMLVTRVNCYNSIYHYVVEIAPRIKALRLCPHCEINDENYMHMFPINKNRIARRLNMCYRRAGMLDVLENIDVRVPGAEGRGEVALDNDSKLAIAEYLSNEELVSFLLAMGMQFLRDAVTPRMINCRDLRPPNDD